MQSCIVSMMKGSSASVEALVCVRDELAKRRLTTACVVVVAGASEVESILGRVGRWAFCVVATLDRVDWFRDHYIEHLSVSNSKRTEEENSRGVASAALAQINANRPSILKIPFIIPVEVRWPTPQKALNSNTGSDHLFFCLSRQYSSKETQESSKVQQWNSSSGMSDSQMSPSGSRKGARSTSFTNCPLMPVPKHKAPKLRDAIQHCPTAHGSRESGEIIVPWAQLVVSGL